MSDYEASIISVGTEEGQVGFSTTGFHKEVLEEEADKLGISLSAACRYWISTGIKLHGELDPRDGNFEPTAAEAADPLAELVISSVPQGEENAQHMDEIIENLQKEIEDKFLDVVEEQNEINRNRWEVYK